MPRILKILIGTWVTIGTLGMVVGAFDAAGARSLESRLTAFVSIGVVGLFLGAFALGLMRKRDGFRVALLVMSVLALLVDVLSIVLTLTSPPKDMAVALVVMLSVLLLNVFYVWTLRHSDVIDWMDSRWVPEKWDVDDDLTF